jgi:hypothetical protein
MTAPYRDADFRCPACSSGLRPFHQRLCCDDCRGIMLQLTDFQTAIAAMTAIAPRLEFIDAKAGTRPCPHCRLPMTTCRVQITLDDNHVTARATIDRCDQHGIWFDDSELSQVLDLTVGD